MRFKLYVQTLTPRLHVLRFKCLSARVEANAGFGDLSNGFIRLQVPAKA